MLADRIALRKAREACEGAFNREKKKILVCAGTGCVSSGSPAIYEAFISLMKNRNIPYSVELREESGAAPPLHGQNPIGVKRSGCHGFCEMGPLVLIEPDGFLYTKVRLEDCEEIIEETILKGAAIERLSYRKNGKAYPRRQEIPFYGKQTRLVLEHCGQIDAMSIKEYLAAGGYRAFEKALFDMDAEQIVGEISESNLRGRGGGGLPAGRKWSQVKRQPAGQ
jgi:NADH-quinone oxidoreductase subunit F